MNLIEEEELMMQQLLRSGKIDHITYASFRLRMLFLQGKLALPSEIKKEDKI